MTLLNKKQNRRSYTKHHIIVKLGILESWILQKILKHVICEVIIEKAVR